MANLKMSYFSEEDILHLVISEEEEANSIELSSNITVELNEKGELIGIEILQASEFVRDAIMEGVQAKVLNLVCRRRQLTLAGFFQCSWPMSLLGRRGRLGRVSGGVSRLLDAG